MPSDLFPPIAELAGSSPITGRVREAASRAAGNGEPVLILAEAGLNAETVAHAVHQASARRGGSFVAIDCTGSDAADLERRIFGRDSFGGSVLLQRLEELPAPLQARLARVIRDGQIETDASGEGIPFDVRVLATVSDTVKDDLQDGTLRRELYARFTHRLEIPALRHRPSDIPALIGCLIGELSAASGVPVPSFTREALTLLSALPWRRNLEELREVLDVLVLGAVGGSVRLEDVLGHVPVERTSPSHAPTVSLREARLSFERQYIASVLHRHRGRMEDAARSLGIQRTNLYRKVRQLGLARVKS